MIARSRRSRWSIAWLLPLLGLIGAYAVHAVVPGANWPSYAGPDENHYSPLDQIDEGNVATLGLAWSARFDTARAKAMGFEADSDFGKIVQAYVEDNRDAVRIPVRL